MFGVYSNQSNPILTIITSCDSHVLNVIGDVIKMSHDHFGKLRNNQCKTQVKSKIVLICKFSCSFEIKAVVSVRYFLMLCVHLKILQNIQQIKELQTTYENRKQFTISLNGTYAKL